MGAQLSSNAVSAVHDRQPLLFLAQEKELICYNLTTLELLQRYVGHSNAISAVACCSSTIFTLADNCLRQFQIKGGMLLRSFNNSPYTVLTTHRHISASKFSFGVVERVLCAMVHPTRGQSEVHVLDVVSGEVHAAVALPTKDDVHFLVTNSMPNAHRKLAYVQGGEENCTRWQRKRETQGQSQDRLLVAGTANALFVLDAEVIEREADNHESKGAGAAAAASGSPLIQSIVTSIPVDAQVDDTIQAVLLIDDAYVISGHNKGMLRLIDLTVRGNNGAGNAEASGDLGITRYPNFHADQIKCLIISQTNEYVAVGSKDGIISIFALCRDAGEERVMHERCNLHQVARTPPLLPPPANAAASHPPPLPSPQLSNSNQARLVLFRELRGHAGEINSLEFSEADIYATGSTVTDDHFRFFAFQGLQLVSTSKDKTIRVWDVASGLCVRSVACDEEPSETLVRYLPVEMQLTTKRDIAPMRIDQQEAVTPLAAGAVPPKCLAPSTTLLSMMFTRQVNRLVVYSLGKSAEEIDKEVLQPEGNTLQVFYVCHEMLPLHNQQDEADQLLTRARTTSVAGRLLHPLAKSSLQAATRMLAVRTDFKDVYHADLLEMDSGYSQGAFRYHSGFFFPFGLFNNSLGQSLFVSTRDKTEVEKQNSVALNESDPTSSPLYNLGMIRFMQPGNGDVIQELSAPNQLSHFMFSNHHQRIYCRMYSNDEGSATLKAQIYFLRLPQTGASSRPGTALLPTPVPNDVTVEMSEFPQRAPGKLPPLPPRSSSSSSSPPPVPLSAQTRGILDCGAVVSAFAVDDQCGILVVATQEKSIQIRDLDSHAIVQEFAAILPAEASHFSVRTLAKESNADGTSSAPLALVAIGCENGEILIFVSELGPAASRSWHYRYRLQGHDKRINSIDFHSVPWSQEIDGLTPSSPQRDSDMRVLLFSGADDCHVHMYELLLPTSGAGLYRSRGASELQVNPTSTMISVKSSAASAGGEIQVISPVRNFKGHESGVLCVALLPSCTAVASSSRDSTIRVHQLNADGREVCMIQNNSPAAYLVVNNHWIWCGSETNIQALDWRMAQMGIVRTRQIKVRKFEHHSDADTQITPVDASASSSPNNKPSLLSGSHSSSDGSSKKPGDEEEEEEDLRSPYSASLSERAADFFAENGNILQFLNLFVMMLVSAFQLLSFGLPNVTTSNNNTHTSTSIVNGTVVDSSNLDTSPGVQSVRNWTTTIPVTFFDLYIGVIIILFLFFCVLGSQDRISWWIFLQGPKKATLAKVFVGICNLVCNWMATALYLPILTVLLLTFRCESNSLLAQPSITCWEGGHIGMVTASALLIVLYTLLSFRLVRIGCEVTRMEWVAWWNPFSWTLDNANDAYRHPLSPPKDRSVTALAAGPFLAKLLLNSVDVFVSSSSTPTLSAYTAAIGCLQTIFILAIPNFVSPTLNRLNSGLAIAIAISYVIVLIEESPAVNLDSSAVSSFNKVGYPITMAACIGLPFLLHLISRRCTTRS